MGMEPHRGGGLCREPHLRAHSAGDGAQGTCQRCQHSWEPLRPHGGWQVSPTAASDGDRTGLTLPRGCWAWRVWPSSTRISFASQFPMDASLLHRLQLALCSPEALTKAELSLCTGKQATGTRTRTVGMVRQAEMCPSPSLLLLLWPFLATSSSSNHPSWQCSCGFRTLHAVGLAAAGDPVTLSSHPGEASLFTPTAV